MSDDRHRDTVERIKAEALEGAAKVAFPMRLGPTANIFIDGRTVGLRVEGLKIPRIYDGPTPTLPMCRCVIRKAGE